MSVTPGRSTMNTPKTSASPAQLDWDIGDINLTSITAYRDWDAKRDQDIDFSAMDRAYRDDLEVGVETFTQEIRLQGECRPRELAGRRASTATKPSTQTDSIRYGAQADAYINNLLGLIDFSAAGAPDINGAAAGHGTNGVRLHSAQLAVRHTVRPGRRLAPAAWRIGQRAWSLARLRHWLAPTR